MNPVPGPPLWLLAELTYRCPLHCAFCYNPLDFARHEDELPTADWLRILREARSLGAVQCGFSGGEPLLREDLEELVAEAHALGYYTNLLTSGVGVLVVEHQKEIGPLAIAGTLMVGTLVCLASVVRTARPFSWGPVESPTVAFDYILLLGVLRRASASLRSSRAKPSAFRKSRPTSCPRPPRPTA